MATGSEVRTLSTLIKYTMSKETAELIKDRFIEMGTSGESVSYLDCVLFDSALEKLGIEQEYYGYGDDEWREMLKARELEEKRYNKVKTIDVTDTWRELV